MRGAHARGATERSRELSLVVGLKLRHADELARLLRDMSDPGSPHYRRYLQPEEFAERFGPAPQDVTAVVKHLGDNGLTVADVSASQQLITATGSVAAAERAFGVSVIDYDQNGAPFFAPQQAPALPAAIAGAVSSVQGLENHTELRAFNTGGRIPPQDRSPFGPGDIARLYNFSPFYAAGVRGNDSRASTIAIATAFGFEASDVAEFWRALGVNRRADQLEVIAIGGALTRNIDETTLDVEWAGAMAPGARLLVYAGADSAVSTFTLVYDRIVSDNRAAVVTVSWGLCEKYMPAAYLDQTHAIFQRAAAQGITIAAASGDHGAFECGSSTPEVNYPASDPLVTAIGGTTLEVSPDGRRLSERAWTGSGGGVSRVWQRPSWQMNSAAWRQSADVAFNADPGTGYYVHNNGTWWQYGGTSLGAPIWAALLALTNQYRSQLGQGELGVAAPALCEVGTQPAAGGALIDVTEGNNGHYEAAAGWDYPTGWGVPDAWALAEALAAPASAPLSEGGSSLTAYLLPASAAVRGSVRVSAVSHCGRARVTASVRGLPAGLYRLAVDAVPVREFAVSRSGRARTQVAAVDPRGRLVSLLDEDGRTLFAAEFPDQPLPSIRLQAPLQSRGRFPAARGLASYRSAEGAEQFTLKVSGLPAGTYELWVGNQLAATLQVEAGASGQSSGSLRFDSRNLAGSPSPVELRCQSLRLRRDGVVALELTATAPGTGICPAL
ncbi:MAG: S8/S53 family peptidase [Deltaproteobacteria bacterium]|nr:S8/S53 family peptidase [Deltaproteobacteria bacterium]